MLSALHLFGCIHVPDFFVQASLLYGTPDLPAAISTSFREARASFQMDPVAVLDGPDSLLKVVACNQRARMAGLKIGMTKLQAETCPAMVLRRRVQEHEALAQQALVDCGYDFASQVESTGAGTVIVDLTGAERLLGPAPRMAQQLAERSVACGFEANIGIAANPDAALHAARGFRGATILAAGEEARRLGSLPVDVLELEPEALETLESWGVRDCKSLAALPKIPLSQRLGQYGLHLQRLARGEVQRELVPAQRPRIFAESMELEEAVDLLEPLGFVLNRLLEQLMTRLKARSLATDEVRVDLGLEVHCDRQLEDDPAPNAGGPLHQCMVKLPVPTQDAKALLKLLQLDLAERPPWAPVRKVTIEAQPARVRTTQTGLFQPRGPEPAQLEITLARLRAVVGDKDEEGRGLVGFPVVTDSHRPDSFEVMPTFMPTQNKSKRPERGECPRLAMRMFRPPHGARVEIRGSVPAAVAFNGIRAKVTHASGPWRSGGEWWSRSGAWQREEWDVELEMRGVYRIFRDAQSGEWFVQGMYD
jgi:protein ImuB